jgi:RES domain-containing protein
VGAVADLARPTRPLKRFPSLVVDGVLWRVHRSDRNPGWWSSDGSGRFDLSPPHGTLYAARQQLTGLLEAIGHSHTGTSAVPHGFLSERSITTFAVGSVRLANLSDRRIGSIGMSNSITTTGDYWLCQQWADAWHSDRQLDGVRWRSRFDPATRSNSVALFGQAGARPLAIRQTISATAAIPALERLGWTVAAAPLAAYQRAARPPLPRTQPN